MKKLIAAASLTAILLVSCTPKAATSTAAAGTSTSTAEQIAQGKTIFENSCAKCHKLPEPTKHDNQGWINTLSRMAPKAKLSDDQHQMVYDYLISVNKK